MLAALRYHFGHLLDFSGRDARQTFWYWFLFLFIVNMAAGFAMTIPLMAKTMASAFEVARTGNQAAMQAVVVDQIAGSMAPMVELSIALGVANLALMAAAFVRRLHDSGRSGVWAALAGAIYAGTLALSWTRIGEMTRMVHDAAANPQGVQAMAIQARMGWQGLIGYVPIIMIIGFGVLKSDPGANRFGADPVRF
jgi:uncharacterized membrane protein YhaH (DUF805 family)